MIQRAPMAARKRLAAMHPWALRWPSVRIPTILRTYTGGGVVEGSATPGRAACRPESRHGGLQERLVDDAGLRRFVNVYLNDEDVRFLGGLSAPVKDGDTITVLPAVAGGMR
jgi:molybdopterin converting factor small subunit